MAKSDTACERIVDRITAHCLPASPPPVAAHPDPNWDHLANSFALAGDAVMYATFGLALLVTLATFGWFIYVRHRTREEAKSEVARVAPEHVRAYLDERLPGMVADAFAALVAGQDHSSSGGAAAEEQARDLGGEPR